MFIPGGNILDFFFYMKHKIFLKEKEIYRWPARESLKTMLAMGWSLERNKDGENITQQRENEKLRSISQSSQVK